jgi:hypothetical protein
MFKPPHCGRRRFMHGRRVFALLPALVLAIAAASTLSAQVADAVIAIVAIDESGAALPGVTVTVSRADTGYVQAIVTDAGGIRPRVGRAARRLRRPVRTFRVRHPGGKGGRAPRRPDGTPGRDAESRASRRKP